MTPPHIRLARSLLEHPTYISAPLKQKLVLIALIQHACFLPTQFDDHGVLIDLLPGQLCASYIKIAQWAGVKKNDAERGIARFSKVKILSHEVRHVKNVVSITHLDSYMLFNPLSETSNETRVRQERDVNRERENREYRSTSLRSVDLPPNDSDKPKSSAAAKIIFNKELAIWENISADQIQDWEKAYPGINIQQELLKMIEWLISNPERNPKSKIRNFITSWLTRSQNFLSQKITQNQERKYGTKQANNFKQDPIERAGESLKTASVRSPFTR